MQGGAEGRLSHIALSGHGSLRSIADSLEDKRSVHKRRPHATNEERAAMAKSSVHAPKESPPSSGSSHIKRKRDPLYRLTKKKAP